MTRTGTVIEGKYEVLKEIGRGGMSIVYLAMDKRLNKQWAVKEIRKKGSGKNDEIVVNSLLAEANMMKRLDHPALPRIVDIIDNGITIYIVMDYIEGESLDKILNEYGAQPEEMVLNWAKQLCDALSYLHSQKPPIIYRDMKPANVMLKPEGNIKIIDFGIAREYKELSLADTTVLGTKGYAPPEQYSGQTDPRSDIFALGMTMHHLLTGVDPRSGEPYAPVRQWNPEISDGVEAIIDKCVQPASENRYQNCTDLLYDLEHPELITKDFKRKQKRKLRIFIASAILCVLMLVAGFVCNTFATEINDSTYESYIASNDLAQYQEAIALYPNKVAAYNKVLDYYDSIIAEEEALTDEDMSKIEAICIITSDKTEADPEGFFEWNFKLGTMCYTYYNGNEVARSLPYFKANHEALESGLVAESESAKISECYYDVCTFWSTYILEGGRGEASPNDFYDLFNNLRSRMDTLENDDSATKYDKLVLCNCIFTLLYEQRDQLAAHSVDLTRVLDLFDYVYSSATEIEVISTKQNSVILQNGIRERYELYRSSIINTYNERAKER